MTIKQLKQDLSSIKKEIGYPDFPKEKDKLLIQSFIRRSYSQEHPEWQHNQVLEFIGDSVLDSYFVRLLCSPEFNNYGSFNDSNQFVSTKDEGELTKMKSEYVNGQVLAKHIDNLKLGQYLILGGADEKNNVRNKQATKEDLFEAIVGAVALACGFDKNIIHKVCGTMLKLNSSNNNQQKQQQNQMLAEMRKLVGTPDFNQSISQLYRLYQQGFINKPIYSPEEVHDKNGNPLWNCTCDVKGYDGRINKEPQRTKKEATRIVAFGMLQIILGYKKAE